MKAVVVQRPGTGNPLEVVELPDPGRPGTGEVRVRLHGSSINYTDTLVIGDPATPAGHVPNADGAGVVEEVGPGVHDLKPGDNVFATFFPFWHEGPPTVDNFGRTPGVGIPGHAQEIVVTPADQFLVAPQGYSHPEAATLTVAAVTAWRALIVDAAVKPGDTVLVMGTGGVSMFALQFAKLAGATVVATSSSDDKLEQARKLGADHTVNYRSVPEWGRHVAELTGGGVDTVVEVGGPSTLAQSIGATRTGGLVSLIGTLTGFSGEVPTGLLNMKQIRLHGIVVGNRRHQQDMVRAIEASGLRPVIDRTYPLDRTADAVRYLSTGAHVGKVALSF